MSNPVLTKERPSFSDIWKNICLEPAAIALCAEVPVSVVNDMRLCHPVERDDARKVLEELSILLRKTYTLEDVYIPLREQAGAR